MIRVVGQCSHTRVDISFGAPDSTPRAEYEAAGRLAAISTMTRWHVEHHKPCGDGRGRRVFAVVSFTDDDGLIDLRLEDHTRYEDGAA